LDVPGLKNQVISVESLKSGNLLEDERAGVNIEIDLNGIVPDNYNTVLKMEIEEKPEVVKNKRINNKGWGCSMEPN
jgi:hypothetical protein